MDGAFVLLLHVMDPLCIAGNDYGGGGGNDYSGGGGGGGDDYGGGAPVLFVSTVRSDGFLHSQLVVMSVCSAVCSACMACRAQLYCTPAQCKVMEELPTWC